jgi:hypothetical protein
MWLLNKNYKPTGYFLKAKNQTENRLGIEMEASGFS